MKKGQITIFIILGIAMVIAFFLWFYLRGASQKFVPDQVVPEEVIPLQQFVNSCVYDTAKDAIVTMGLQSGFIQIPSRIKSNAASYLAVDPYGLLFRPYWYYNGESRVPTEEYLKYQISDYVEKNLGKCISGFSSFRSQFKVIAANPKVSTVLQDSSVAIELDYPIEVRDLKLEKVTKLRYFKQDIPVRLKAAYQLAAKIMEAENNQQFLENVTIDIMAADPDIPFTGMEFHCGAVKWSLQQLKKELQTVMFYNIPRIRVENTNYAPFDAPKSSYEKFKKYTMKEVNEGKLPATSPPNDAYEYFHFLLDAGNTDKTMSAKFVYRPEQGMDFMAIPSKDGVLSSKSISGEGQFLSFLCINLYHFVYDLSYPVEVFIRDDSSFGGTGYVFSFAFPVMIHHNSPDRAQHGVMNFEPAATTEGFCENLGSQQYTFTAFGTYEGYTDMEIPGVKLDYECMFHRCHIGETRAESGHYRLSANLPDGCANPFIIANKTGYLASRQQVTDTTVNINMKKLKPLKFKVVKHVYEETSGSLGDAEQLSDKEAAVISLDLVNGSYRQFAQYPSNLSNDTFLVEDNAAYGVEIIFLKDNDQAGGYVNAAYSVSGGDVLNANQITFHVVEYRPTPVDQEQKLRMTGYLTEGKYKDKLKPTLTQS